MATAQPSWRYLGNLGDQGDPVEHGGLFVYEDETGVYGFEMEKLEELCDDDRCETCDNEPFVKSSEELEDLEHRKDDDLGWVDDDADDYEEQIERVLDKYAPLIEAEKAKLRAAHAEWEKHVAAHTRWTVYRVQLEQFKIVRKYDTENRCTCSDDIVNASASFEAHEKVCPNRTVKRYLVPRAYDDTWDQYALPSRRAPWFYDDLEDIASSMSTTKRDLLRCLVSADWRDLVFVWRCILDYHGWENGDSYPLHLSRPEVLERYKKELSRG